MYIPNYTTRQDEALTLLSPANLVTETVLYGGSAGGGKTFLGCSWQINRRLKYANTRGLRGRAELKRLRQSTMATFWTIANQMGLRPGTHYTYNGQDHVIKFYNGSQIVLMDLGYMPSDAEFTRLGSIEITDYFVDESAEVSKRAIDILDSRVRYNLINGIPKGLLSCNPSKGWLYSDFFDAHRNGTLREDRAFVKALPTDNPNLEPAYLEKLSRLPIIIDDYSSTSLARIRTQCLRYKAKHGKLRAIIVDYLQLMTMEETKKGNKADDIGVITRGLKLLAKELECPIILLSQLNRGVEGRDNKRPMLQDLRSSGDIEQDADMVWFIYRDEVYNADTPQKAEAEIIIAKNRGGEIGIARLAWKGEFTKFTPRAEDIF
jgi:hypothetical protein